MRTVILADLLVPPTPPAYVLIHSTNWENVQFTVLIFTMKCTKMSPTMQQYLATIPEYEYLSSSPPSSITELDWSGRVRTSTSSELRMEWTCLDNPHCWDKTGE